jgi:hypothetical protein
VFTYRIPSRNLTFKGKTLIVKNFLLAQMGFETEMRGIPEKYKKGVNDLIWKFLVACRLQTCIFLPPLRAAPHSRVV